MKFNKIKISEKTTKSKGIQEINLSRLSNVIAFVGKNGSGKTRILDILEEHIFTTIVIQRLLDKSIIGLPKSLQEIINNLEVFKEHFFAQEKIAELNLSIKKEPSNKEIIIELQSLQTNPKLKLHPNNAQQVNSLVSNAQQILPTLKQNYLRRIKYSEIQKLQEAIADLSKDNSITFEKLIENISDKPYDEFKSIHKSALKYLSKLPHELTFDYQECLGDESKYEKRTSYKRFLSLKKLIKNFLNKDLTWEIKLKEKVVSESGVKSNHTGLWKLDNREFNYMEFSDGEKTLFSYALLFFLLDQNPTLNIKDSIILVDEPELHLHPDSEIDLINGMRNAIGENGQLIFATHSINILSSLNYDEIFMVKNGVIKHPSQSTVGESLSELMSLEERVNKLSDFLSSIATWTFVNFMAECFSNPEVIESARPDDPQIIAFKKAVTQVSSNPSNLLLDFGAGKGRLYEQIKLDYEFISKVNYYALEPDVSFHENLKKLGAKEVYNNHSHLPKESFDFILLCNVLHEIPIIEWKESLNSIIEALKEEGYLVIIEAKILTKGERIGKEGFILLDLEELKFLFSLPDLPTSISIKGKEEIITCAIISKKQLSPIHKNNIFNTLKALENNTLNKLIALRENYEENDKNLIGLGRKNAFLSQLHINSRIAQLTLDKNNERN